MKARNRAFRARVNGSSWEDEQGIDFVESNLVIYFISHLVIPSKTSYGVGRDLLFFFILKAHSLPKDPISFENYSLLR